MGRKRNVGVLRNRFAASGFRLVVILTLDTSTLRQCRHKASVPAVQASRVHIYATHAIHEVTRSLPVKILSQAHSEYRGTRIF